MWPTLLQIYYIFWRESTWSGPGLIPLALGETWQAVAA
jgi:hypothetical protein